MRFSRNTTNKRIDFERELPLMIAAQATGEKFEVDLADKVEVDQEILRRVNVLRFKQNAGQPAAWAAFIELARSAGSEESALLCASIEGVRVMINHPAARGGAS